jgi:surface protein
MKPNLIHLKLNDKSNIILNKVLELYKLSVGNKLIDLDYNKNKKEFSNQNLEIIYYKKYIKKNIGKMIYETTGNKEIKIYNEEFITNNIKRAKMIINSKQYKLKENIENPKRPFKIEIKFLDNIIKLNSMFSNCKSLYSINNFKNLNTKYLKTIFELFAGCNSLSYIDDISNWNINNINNISKLFCECSKIKELPDISKWNISNVNNMSKLFYKCHKIKSLPDI